MKGGGDEAMSYSRGMLMLKEGLKKITKALRPWSKNKGISTTLKRGDKGLIFMVVKISWERVLKNKLSKDTSSSNSSQGSWVIERGYLMDVSLSHEMTWGALMIKYFFW